jgi:hypothetical protein
MAERRAKKNKTNGFNAIWRDYRRINRRVVIKMGYFLLLTKKEKKTDISTGNSYYFH